MAVVRAMLANIPVLRARETLLAASRFALGSGAMAPEDRRRMIDELQRAAWPDAPRRKTPKASPAELMAMGIGLRKATTHGQ